MRDLIIDGGGLVLSAVGMSSSSEVFAIISAISAAVLALCSLLKLCVRVVDALREYARGKSTLQDTIDKIDDAAQDAQDEIEMKGGAEDGNRDKKDL